MSDTFIQYTGIGFAVHDATHVDVHIFNNDIEHTRRNAVSTFDVGGSRIRVVDNRIAAEGTIINNYRGLDDFTSVRPPPSSEPSSFLIARNSITLTGLGDFGADPINTTDWLGTTRTENPNAGIDTWDIVNNDIVLDVTGPDAGRAIGKKGQTLDALQFLVNKIVNRFPDGRRHVVVDSGDYRDRHDKGLISLARREAKRALDEGQVVALQPMSARDRRVIHLSLAKFEGVTTESSGEGMHRRIEIILAPALAPKAIGRAKLVAEAKGKAQGADAKPDARPAAEAKADKPKLAEAHAGRHKSRK